MHASRRNAGVCIFCRQFSSASFHQSDTRARRSAYTYRPRLFSTSLPRPYRNEKESGQDFRRISFSGSRSLFKDRSRPTRVNSPRDGRGPRLPYRELLSSRLGDVKRELATSPIVKSLDVKRDGRFKDIWKRFTQKLIPAHDHENEREVDPADIELRETLRQAYRERGESGLDDRLKYAFYGTVTGARFTEGDITHQKALADLRYPSEWYPATRSMHRTIHMHVGPTNSGKTYHALKRLEAAESGIYAGPLRLLAHEVYTRLNAQGKRCLLVTGEERRSPDETMKANLSSCTVEMIPVNATVDVAVIDEIQMIGNADRGWAWTQAVLGVKARELHLCGEARTVPLVREICASVGEQVIVHEYERLSPLEMAETSLNGNLKDLRKGDCIVSFSVVGIHALRRQIEMATGKKVATVYGSLPPETRAHQARLFNDPNNDYDFLVASDAIGMGLNLSIKRIIFEESGKFDGYSRKTLGIADIKQIAGRAGRYRSADQAKNADESKTDLASVKGETAEDTAMETVDIGVSHDSVELAKQADESEGDVASDKGEIAEDIVAKTVDTGVSLDDVEPAMEVTIDSLHAESARPKSEYNSEQPDSKVLTFTRAPKDTSNVGLVTTLENFDFPIIAEAMKGEPEPIRTAGIFPPAVVIERFAQYFPPATPFSFIMLRLHELSQMHTRFHLCGLKDQLWIADLIEPVRNLTISDRIILCACPASKQDSDLNRMLLPALARCVEQQSGGHLLDIKELPLETLEEEVVSNRPYLRQLEQLHKGIISYLWLSYRFAGIFSSRPLAFHVKQMVEERIEKVLSGFDFSSQSKSQKLRRKKEQAILDSFLGTAEQAEGESRPRPPDNQSSMISGGDRFGSEDDIDILDPAEDEQAPDGHTYDLPPNFGESGFAQENDTSSDANEHIELERDQSRPAETDADADSEAVAAGGLSPEESNLNADSGIRPETEVKERPLATQEVPPTINDEEQSRDETHSARTGTLDAPKHWHEIDTANANVEKDVTTRP